MRIDRQKVRKAIKDVAQKVDQEREKAEALAKTLHVVHLPPDVANVFEQITAVLPPGVKRAIRCPYCKALNIEGQKLCCDGLRGAIVKALDAKPEKANIN